MYTMQGWPEKVPGDELLLDEAIGIGSSRWVSAVGKQGSGACPR